MPRRGGRSSGTPAGDKSRRGPVSLLVGVTRVTWSGTGIDLRTGSPSPAAVRVAVQRVLADPSYAARARALAPTAPTALAAERAAALLAVLAATGRAVVRTVSRR